MSHLIADTLDELHEFAGRLGLRRDWYQDGGWIPHYDVSEGKREEAIAKGAVAVPFGREPWRCNTCDLAKLECVSKMHCECGD